MLRRWIRTSEALVQFRSNTFVVDRILESRCLRVVPYASVVSFDVCERPDQPVRYHSIDLQMFHLTSAAFRLSKLRCLPYRFLFFSPPGTHCVPPV
jgi:hypothetical protein